MIDRWTSQWIRPLLEVGARSLHKKGIMPDQVTVCGFLTGIIGAVAISFGFYLAGFVCILVNRLADGLDGSLARISETSDAGAYLDIVLDFIFYSAIVFGFALADPEKNSLAAAGLIFSFIGTGCSFLSYAIMAERRSLTNLNYPHKGFFYLGGLAEGTETILFFCAFCFFPAHFPLLAWIFAGICLVTTATRVVGGYYTIKADDN